MLAPVQIKPLALNTFLLHEGLCSWCQAMRGGRGISRAGEGGKEKKGEAGKKREEGGRKRRKKRKLGKERKGYTEPEREWRWVRGVGKKKGALVNFFSS